MTIVAAWMSADPGAGPALASLAAGNIAATGGLSAPQVQGDAIVQGPFGAQANYALTTNGDVSLALPANADVRVQHRPVHQAAGAELDARALRHGDVVWSALGAQPDARPEQKRSPRLDPDVVHAPPLGRVARTDRDARARLDAKALQASVATPARHAIRGAEDEVARIPVLLAEHGDNADLYRDWELHPASELAAHADGCRHPSCLHDGEPGCAVQEAAGRGEIHLDRLESYRRILRELRRG